MTISARTRTYRLCWFLAVAFAAASVPAALILGTEALSAPHVLPGFPSGDAASLFARLPGIVPISAGVLCSAYGIAVLFLLSFRYSRTVSMELFFFAFWALAMSSEVLRLESLRGAFQGALFPELSLVTRLVLSMRFLGAFSLFAGSLYSAGYAADRHAVPIGAVLLTSLALGTGLPINTGLFGADLFQRAGYARLYGFISAASCLGAVANYLLAVRITGEQGYRAVAVGCALVFGGGMALHASASPAWVLIGAVSLIAGTILFLRKIHAYYLWL